MITDSSLELIQSRLVEIIIAAAGFEDNLIQIDLHISYPVDPNILALHQTKKNYKLAV
jgi:hypothetical protein